MGVKAVLRIAYSNQKGNWPRAGYKKNKALAYLVGLKFLFILGGVRFSGFYCADIRNVGSILS